MIISKATINKEIVLVSQYPLPYHKQGSWTNLYNYYLDSAGNQIETIICTEPLERISSLNYLVVKNNLWTRFTNKIKGSTQTGFIKQLLIHIARNQEYELHVVDNFSFVKELYRVLKHREDLKAFLKIKFFYHGFDPYLSKKDGEWFFKFIDTFVCLTQQCLAVHNQFYDTIACSALDLHNGINTSIFYRYSQEYIDDLKKEFSAENKTIFLWCGRDVPKKGLDILLLGWELVLKSCADSELWLIGTERFKNSEGVRSFGKVVHADIAKFYNVADCFVLPSQCNEGFGLSMVEALHCGCYVIASNRGGIEEVLKGGVYGKLLNDYTNSGRWSDAMINYVKERPSSNFDFNDYNLDDWIRKYNMIIND